MKPRSACLLLSLPLLSSACLLPSTDVGETPPAGETETTTDTEGETDPEATSSQSATGTAEASAGGPGTSMGTGMGMEETGPIGTGAPANCVDEEYDCFGVGYVPLDCGPEPVCDLLQVSRPFGDVMATSFVNPEAATCILEGLAAGTPGLYQISVEQDFNVVYQYRYDVHADDSVIERIELMDDKTCSGTDTRLQLNPAEHFIACQALETDQLVLDCMQGVGLGDACTFDPLCD